MPANTPDIAKLAAEMRQAAEAASEHGWDANYDAPSPEAILTLIDALDARGRETEGRWLDIASAPKDGTPFLAYWLRRYSDGTRYEAAQAFVVAHYMGARLFPHWIDKDDQPTHWMPLPAPPLARETVFENDEHDAVDILPCPRCLGSGLRALEPEPATPWQALQCGACWGGGRTRRYRSETPEERWARMRRWAESNIARAR